MWRQKVDAAVLSEQLMRAEANRLRGENKRLRESLKWLDEFVEEPELFPADGDRQWWQERRQSIRELAK